jgi:2-polyprenyl-3-methyl-5-hydroxy-6-metoxy-1,4-benzoquinol methylase
MLYSVCPLCQERKLRSFLSCKDYTVSHETFHLEKCANCGFVLTNPQPEEKDLARYYQSDAYISHSNKSLSIIDQAYKVSRNFTLKWKYKLIQKHSLYKPVSILDYGCGTGAFLQECKKHQVKIVGVEPSSVARSIARQTTSTEIYEDLTQVNQKVDAITQWHVLEHVTDLHGTLEALKTRLDENGTMFIAVPNHQSSDAKQYREHWAGYDVPRHLWHFSRETMKRLLTTHHLNLVNVVPMQLDAYYVSLLSEKYKTEKTGVSGLIKAVAEGWKSNHAAKKTAEFSSLIYIARK